MKEHPLAEPLKKPFSCPKRVPHKGAQGKEKQGPSPCWYVVGHHHSCMKTGLASGEMFTNGIILA
jgi:hypothetical protein